MKGAMQAIVRLGRSGGARARGGARRRGSVPLRGARATAAVPRRGRASLSSCAKVVTCVTRYHLPTRKHYFYCTPKRNESIQQSRASLFEF